MSHSGTIKLIHQGNVNNQAEYRDRSERKKIIEMWRELYGMEFEKCAIQIVPEIKEQKRTNV